MSNIYYFLAIIPAIILHEVSHGYVAYLCGDPTAKNAKRLTLNPIRHVDPFGTLILPLVLIVSHIPPIGYAKPVPVNVSRLRKPRNQSVYVSLAGPLTNIVLSALAFLYIKHAIVHLNGQAYLTSTTINNYVLAFGLVNMLLAVFNLLPIPPLDGSAVIERFVPRRHLPAYYNLRARALPIVMALLILNAITLHLGETWFGSLQNWWLNLAAS